MKKKIKLLTVSALICQLAGLAIAASPSYLLLSHDPAFLEEIGKVSDVVYSAGRTRLVELKVPVSEIPAPLALKLRPLSIGEVYNGPAPSARPIVADPAVKAILAKVDANRLMGYAEAITAAGKRSTAQLDVSANSGNRAAMDYIAKTFKEMGYNVESQCYKNRKADKECNIVARRPTGKTDARAILVIGHMDSVGYPNAGADDNASGAAGVLEMAKVLSGYKADHDLIFVTSNGEEDEMVGSYACAKKLKASGELAKVAWAINMDMIAWNKDGIIELETNKEYSAYTDWVAGLMRTYTKQEPYIAMPAWGSDHVPFLEAGIPTYLAIEHWENHNPCYHRSCDQLEGLRWDYASDIVKLNLAVVAGKAKLTPAQ